jgi:hypothetical protein
MDFKKYIARYDSEEINYVARIFAPFSEEIVRIWCKRKNSKYKDLGRPSLYKNIKYTHKTFDFTFEKDGEYFIGEQKNWIAVDNGYYLTEIYLNDADLNILDEVLRNKEYEVYCGNISQKLVISGVVLIWPQPTAESIMEFRKKHPRYKVLSFQDIINDLINENNQEYLQLLERYKKYCDNLFKELLPKNS